MYHDPFLKKQLFMKKYQRNFLIILTILLGLAFPLINKEQKSFQSEKVIKRPDNESLTGAGTKINKLTIRINSQLKLKDLFALIPDSSNGLDIQNHNLLNVRVSG